MAGVVRVAVLVALASLTLASPSCSGRAPEHEIEFVTLYFGAVHHQREFGLVALFHEHWRAGEVFGPDTPEGNYGNSTKFVRRGEPAAVVAFHAGFLRSQPVARGSDSGIKNTAVAHIARLRVEKNTLVVTLGFPSFANNDDDQLWSVHAVNLRALDVAGVKEIRVLDEDGVELDYDRTIK